MKLLLLEMTYRDHSRSSEMKYHRAFDHLNLLSKIGKIGYTDVHREIAVMTLKREAAAMCLCHIVSQIINVE